MSGRIVRSAGAAAVLSISIGSGAVMAHHAFSAEFDRDKPVKLQGTLTKMEWVNPHAWLYLDTIGPDGKPVNWAIELGAPNALVRRGWRTSDIKVGVTLLIDGFQAKNGRNVANGRTVKFQDGKELFVGSSGTGAPDDPR